MQRDPIQTDLASEKLEWKLHCWSHSALKCIPPCPVPHISSPHNHSQDTPQRISIIPRLPISSLSPIDLNPFHPSRGQFPPIDPRRTLASFQIHHMRHIPPILAPLRLRHASTLRTRFGNRSNEISRRERLRRRTGLSIICSVQDQDFGFNIRRQGDCCAYIPQDERRDYGRE